MGAPLCCRSRRGPPPLAQPDDAAEPDVTGRRVDRLRQPCRRTVAITIIVGAEMRSALEHFARDSNGALARIEAVTLVAAARIHRNATRLLLVFGMLRLVPVARPLPGVADHIVEAVAVGRECAHRRRSREAVASEILPGEFALPIIRHVAAWR